MSMNETQRKKRNFRASKKWKTFRHEKWVEQKGLCYVTRKKMRVTANLHHLCLDDDLYEDISKRENFVFLSKSMHDVIHDIYRYYKDDDSVLERIKEILEKMKEINK